MNSSNRVGAGSSKNVEFDPMPVPLEDKVECKTHSGIKNALRKIFGFEKGEIEFVGTDKLVKCEFLKKNGLVGRIKKLFSSSESKIEVAMSPGSKKAALFKVKDLATNFGLTQNEVVKIAGKTESVTDLFQSLYKERAQNRAQTHEIVADEEEVLPELAEAIPFHEQENSPEIKENAEKAYVEFLQILKDKGFISEVAFMFAGDVKEIVFNVYHRGNDNAFEFMIIEDSNGPPAGMDLLFEKVIFTKEEGDEDFSVSLVGDKSVDGESRLKRSIEEFIDDLSHGK